MMNIERNIIITESTETGIDKKFLNNLCKQLNLKFSIFPKNNIEGVLSYLEGKKTAEIYNGSINNILIIVDADKNPKKRFQDIVKIIKKDNFSTNYNIPQTLGVVNKKEENKINIGVFLFPNNKDTGSLETLLYDNLNIKSKNKKECAEDYIQCIQNKESEMTENNISKAKFRILNATPNPDRYIKNVDESIDYNSDNLNTLKDFLKQIE